MISGPLPVRSHSESVARRAVGVVGALHLIVAVSPLPSHASDLAKIREQRIVDGAVLVRYVIQGRPIARVSQPRDT